MNLLRNWHKEVKEVKKNTPYHPIGNGRAERQTLFKVLGILRKETTPEIRLEILICFLVQAYKFHYNDATRNAPLILMFG